MKDINPGRDEEFRLVKSIKDDVWLAERVSDGEPFVARRLEELDPLPGDSPGSRVSEEARDAEGLGRLLSECGVDRQLAQILNHENIVSLAGAITQGAGAGAAGDKEARRPRNTWLVWDYPDAGTLEQLFHDGELAKEHGPRRYMPESLCWHVLRSVLSALTYLHEGSRAFCEEDDMVENWMSSVDDDWHPVLHGAVTAENIFFQHPRGTETYGVCKLGNFSQAFISGKVALQYYMDEPEKGIVAGLRDGRIGSLDEIRDNLYSTLLLKTNKRKSYTVKDELWSLGAVVHQMMVGAPPPSPDGCAACNYECNHIQVCAKHAEGCPPFEAACSCDFGGCPHIPTKPCPHPKYPQECPHEKCPRSGVHIQDNLWQKHYSRHLITAVLMLLQPGRSLGDWFRPGKTGEIWGRQEDLYQGWQNETNEGSAYRSFEDDLLDRGLAQEAKRRRAEEEEKRRQKASEKKIWGEMDLSE
ncbi:uncharacterized protein DNG_07639 [Cephalotrichum gorgonifer]|uniref:non-specific serine/threonine protein kinase n=1 Tax=Cephalotrichum gorgonifer TaxID=2041049 RepID=A0AAE8N3P4_9PEZI|nr:uncharacterized protein DNG_07639 [Cephalotrichum gorgonifer]